MNKRLITVIQGGLGNQLFILAKALELKENYLSLSFDTEHGFKRNEKYKTVCRLEYFNKFLRSYATNDIYCRLYRIRVFRYALRVLTRFSKFISILDDNNLNMREYSYLDGYFLKAPSQNIVLEIAEVFFVRELKNMSVKENSRICVHIRSFTFEEKSVNSDWWINQVKNKIILLRDEIGNDIQCDIFSPLAWNEIDKIYNLGSFFYSNGIAWNLVSANNANEMEDFVEMCRYQNFIIPDSTFSSWSAYISEALGFTRKVFIIGDKTAERLAMSNWSVDIENR